MLDGWSRKDSRTSGLKLRSKNQAQKTIRYMKKDGKMLQSMDVAKARIQRWFGDEWPARGGRGEDCAGPTLFM
jgi:hypothetical protein